MIEILSTQNYEEQSYEALSYSQDQAPFSDFRYFLQKTPYVCGGCREESSD